MDLLFKFSTHEDFNYFNDFGGNVRDSLTRSNIPASTGAQHITEILFDGTFAVDYLKCYYSDEQVKSYQQQKQTTIFMSEFHAFGLSEKGTLVKYDFASIDYLDLYG